MGWMTQLYKTYENLASHPETLRSCKIPLVPVSHTLQAAHLEIVLDPDGNIRRVEGIPKDKAMTLVPSTETSASRSSGDSPHMLYDNLKYIAGDASRYFNDKKMQAKYEKYCAQLAEWCADAQCPADVRVIYRYVLQGHVIDDLLRFGIFTAEDGKLTKAWNGDPDNKPTDFAATFVRFRVEKGLFDTVACNQNTELINAYIAYDAKKYATVSLCFATGRRVPVTYNHPAKILHTGDKAKLISATDNIGFKFTGRFRKIEDAVAVGYDISHKAHSALRWLVANQGFKTGDQTVVAWAVSNRRLPSLLADTHDMKQEMEFSSGSAEEDRYMPMEEYARSIQLAVAGYRHNFGQIAENNDVILMIVEAATPGRLSIVYYREFTGFDYLDRIEAWHKSCVWNHNYKAQTTVTDEEGVSKKRTTHIKYTGAPSVLDIIFAGYGKDVDDKLKKHWIEILTACIADGKKLPKEIVVKAVQRCSNPQRLEGWEAGKTLSVTCALIRKYYYEKGVEYDMALDYENTDRSYLFGRVLAYAEKIEEYAQYISGADKHEPNARKLMSKFHMQPARTLVILQDKLAPYSGRLYVKHGWMYDQMRDVLSRINTLDYMNDRPLEPQYLLGYACQYAALRTKKEDVNNDIEEE